MYERFYGLGECPFELTPNSRYLVLTPSHEEALSNLEYGISARKGITLLLGEAGTGKTTLLRKALSLRVRPGDTSGEGWLYLNNPTLSRQEFFEVLAGGFRLGPGAATSKAHLLRELQDLLRERHGRGLVSALIVDEAQSLPHELLEELRLLANIESDTHKLLPLVLAGQPELAERLNDPGLRQFKQRIALRCQLHALSLRETACYIATRIRLAGGDAGRIFTREAVIAIHEAARGIPRTISVICDNALLAGFAVNQQPVDADTIEEVCNDFDLTLAPAHRPLPMARRHEFWSAGRA
jgi:type II secretory pathway predicted ATPase ExeA